MAQNNNTPINFPIKEEGYICNFFGHKTNTCNIVRKDLRFIKEVHINDCNPNLSVVKLIAKPNSPSISFQFPVTNPPTEIWNAIQKENLIYKSTVNGWGEGKYRQQCVKKYTFQFRKTLSK